MYEMLIKKNNFVFLFTYSTQETNFLQNMKIFHIPNTIIFF